MSDASADLYETLPSRKRCRYFLRIGGRTKYLWGFRSKAEVEDWIECRVREHGLDWRVGYTVKLRGELPLFFIVNRHGLSPK